MGHGVTSLHNSLLISNFPRISWNLDNKWVMELHHFRTVYWFPISHESVISLIINGSWSYTTSEQFTDFQFPTNQLFMMMYIQVTLDMRSLSEWLITKLTFVGLNTSMYHIMSLQFRFPWKSFATFWAKEATRFSSDGSKLFQLFLSPRCRWNHAACFDSVAYSKPTWKKQKNIFIWVSTRKPVFGGLGTTKAQTSLRICAV